MMLPVLAALALGAAVWASRRAMSSPETGAADWQAKLAARNARHARNEARSGHAARTRAALHKPRRVRPSADCCAATDDHWKSARDVYDAWKAPDPLVYRQALHECWLESVEAAANGDYSKPASTRCALGKMHASKLSQWKACREGCRRAGLGELGADDPLFEAVGGAFDRWPADDGSGGTVWVREGESDRVRVSPDVDGWAVDLQRNGRGAWRRVDVFGDELAADDAARGLLDVPF